ASANPFGANRRCVQCLLLRLTPDRVGCQSERSRPVPMGGLGFLRFHGSRGDVGNATAIKVAKIPREPAKCKLSCVKPTVGQTALCSSLWTHRCPVPPRCKFACMRVV